MPSKALYVTEYTVLLELSDMRERVNLKEIERKVYTSYHQDGIIDVSIALIVLGFGIWGVVLDMAWMGEMFWYSGSSGSFFLVFWFIGISVYAAAKRVFTIPRIGFVKFAARRVRAMQTSAIIVFSLFALLGVVAFIQVEGGGTPIWLLSAIENLMLVIGVSVAAVFCAVGYTFRIRRMYVYALLNLVMFVIGHFLYFPLYYYVILLGTLILLNGLIMLIRFVRRYPLSATDAMSGGGHEEE